MAYELLIPLRLKQEELAAIGLLAVRWSYFETEMDFTISGLGENVEENQRLPHRFNQRIAYWRKLARKAFAAQPEILGEIEEIITHAKFLFDGRCLVLHGRVFGDPERKSDRFCVEQHRHLDSWTVYKRLFSKDDILQGCVEIEQLAHDLIGFNKKHIPLSPTSWPCILPKQTPPHLTPAPHQVYAQPQPLPEPSQE